ncbi:MAG: alternate-type signal peptide protein [Aeromicrobium sp.]|jgi:alternate signal-mediated exported protein|nr:alternate-type signal peptide protein [Aeromicrobium sp.]
MNRSLKGAAAAGAAAVLLLGGAGSLAYWQATQDAGTADIKSGNITLSPPDCTTAVGSHGWQLDNGDAYVPGTTKIVPGDSISKVCDMTLVLTGEHIGADLTFGTAGLTPDSTTLADELAAGVVFTVDGAAYAPITDPGTHDVRATITVDFDGPGATNLSENGDVHLNAINVVADQTHTP